MELLRKENFKGDVYMRPLLYKADLHGPLQLHDMEDEITIYALPRAGAPSEEGLRLTTSSWRRIDDTMMPARGKLVGAYVNSALIKSEALLAGYDDAVVLTQDGHVSECSGSNLFLIRDGVLCAQALLSTLWPLCCCLLSDADLVVPDLADERTPRQHTLLIPRMPAGLRLRSRTTCWKGSPGARSSRSPRQSSACRCSSALSTGASCTWRTRCSSAGRGRRSRP